MKDPGVITRHDSIGFVTIGAGENHANSQFMFEGYTSNWPFEQALLLTFAAKKRAETAPGVGWGTDMFWIEPFQDYFKFLDARMVWKLQDIWRDAQDSQRVVTDSAYTKVREYFDELRKQAKERQASPEEQIVTLEKQLEEERLREGSANSEQEGQKGRS